MASGSRTIAVPALAALVVLSALGVAGCRKGAPPAKGAAGSAGPPVEVRLGPVERRSLDRTVSVTGTLFGHEEATLSAKVGGRIAAVVLDVDDPASSGDVVVQIDRTDYEIALRERQAALRAALAKLGLTELPGPGFDLAAVPTVERSKAEEANARAKEARARSLFEQKPPLISEQDFADIRTQAEVAARTAEVQMLDARAILAEAQTQAAMIASAEQRLADTAVRAPTPMGGGTIRYRVSERLVSLGELVTAGQAVARVVASDTLKFRGPVPEREMGRIVAGQSAAVTLDAFNSAFPGRVTRVAPRVDQRTRTFDLEIEIANPGGKLKPGAFARASIVVGKDDGVVMVPRDAVATFAGVRRVFSVSGGKALGHRIETGDELDGLVEVIGTIGADQVVVSGGQGLTDGQPVKVLQGP